MTSDGLPPQVRLHRRAGFYVYSIWLPNFLLVTLAFLVLKLEPEEVQDYDREMIDHPNFRFDRQPLVNERVTLVTTLLLASAGYRANIDLPRTPTFSWLEAYLLVCIGALFLLALFSYGPLMTSDSL
jgi:hypothetical protein